MVVNLTEMELMVVKALISAHADDIKVLSENIPSRFPESYKEIILGLDRKFNTGAATEMV